MTRGIASTYPKHMKKLALSSQSRDCMSNLDTWTQQSVSLVITRKFSPSLLVDNNNNNNSIWVCLKIRALPTTKWYIIIVSDIYSLGKKTAMTGYIPYHVQAYLDASAATPVPAPPSRQRRSAAHLPAADFIGRWSRETTRRAMRGSCLDQPGRKRQDGLAWRGNIFQNQRVWRRLNKKNEDHGFYIQIKPYNPWVLHIHPWVLLLFHIILWDFGRI